MPISDKAYLKYGNHDTKRKTNVYFVVSALSIFLFLFCDFYHPCFVFLIHLVSIRYVNLESR